MRRLKHVWHRILRLVFWRILGAKKESSEIWTPPRGKTSLQRSALENTTFSRSFSGKHGQQSFPFGCKKPQSARWTTGCCASPGLHSWQHARLHRSVTAYLRSKKNSLRRRLSITSWWAIKQILVVKILFKCNLIKFLATICYLKVVEEASKMATLMTKEMLDRRWNFNNQVNPAMLDCHVISSEK